jgi:hypothetical protein
MANICLACSCEQNTCTDYDDYIDDARCIPKPDLNIKSSQVLTQNPETEKWVSLLVVLENKGNATADDVHWVLDTDSTQPNPTYGPFSVEAGKSVDIYPAVKYLWPATYNTVFTVDYDNLIEEGDETNNAISIPITVS